MNFCLQDYLSKVDLKTAMLLSSQRYSETVFFFKSYKYTNRL